MEADRSGSDVIHTSKRKSPFGLESINSNPNPGKKMAMEGRSDKVREIDLSVKLEAENSERHEDSELEFKTEKIISPLVYHLDPTEEEEAEAEETSKELHGNYYYDKPTSSRVPTPVTSWIDEQTKIEALQIEMGRIKEENENLKTELSRGIKKLSKSPYACVQCYAAETGKQ
jgi:hypothetical protein